MAAACSRDIGRADADQIIGATVWALIILQHDDKASFIPCYLLINSGRTSCK